MQERRPASNASPPAAKAPERTPMFAGLRAAASRGFGRTDEHEFLPAAVEVLESPPSPAGRILAVSICALFASVIGWASWAEIDIVAVAEGKVIPSGRTKVVQPLEIGVVKTIAVREGQHVKAGELLIELDSTSTGADADRTRQELSAARLEATRLRVVLGLDDGATLDTPPEGVSQAEFSLAMSLAKSQISEQDHRLQSLKQEIQRQKSNAASAQADAAKARETLPLVAERAEMSRQMVEGGVISKMEYLRAQEELVDLKRSLDSASAKVKEAKAAIASLEQQRQQAAAEFERDRMKELTEAESKVKSLAEDLTKADQRQALQRIVSPVDGVVQQLQVHTIGGVVEAAKPLMQIVPEGAPVEIEARILNKDIGFVFEGQEAIIKMEAFPFTRYGTLDGAVTEVSDDAIEDEKLGLLFTARIAVPNAKLQVEDKMLPLSPGMMASVEIKTGSRTMIEYVLSPVMKATGEAGRER
jgi:hemolysin D